MIFSRNYMVLCVDNGLFIEATQQPEPTNLKTLIRINFCTVYQPSMVRCF